MTVTNEQLLSAINDFAQDVQEQFGGVQKQFDGMHEHFTGVHARLESIEQRLDRLEKILDAVQRQVDELRGDFTAHASNVLQRVEYLENELAKIKQKIGFVS